MPPRNHDSRRTPVRILSVLALCACLLFHAGHANALTDEDHTRYAREFPAYAQAEQRLNSAWKQLKQQLSKDEFQTLLAEQRNWISTVRDAEAKALAGPGPFANAAPLANAYASVTTKRAEALEARVKRAAPQNGSATAAAPAAKDASPTQGAATAQGVAGNQRTAPQGAPAAKDAHKTQAAPVVKGSPAAKGAPTAQNAPPANASAKAPVAGRSIPATQPAPSPTPSDPPAGDRPEQPGSIVGSYGSGSNLVEVKASGKGYYVAVSTASPDARWVCEMEGLGVLEGDVLRLTSVSSGQSVVVPIQFKYDSLIIPATRAATCGFGGSIEGVYKKK